MADQKITQLTELAATPDDADILAIVDDVAGTPVTKKITVANLKAAGGSLSKTLTAGETIAGATLPVPVYQNTTDNEFYKCDANVTTKLNFTGFAITNAVDAGNIVIQHTGIVGGFTGLAEGEKYYVQDAVGTIGTTIGTYEVLVGIAVSETELLILKGNDEYCGSNSGTGDLTAPSCARKAIINVANSFNLKGQIVLYKKGATTGKCYGDAGTNYSGVEYSWSGVTLTKTGTVSSATAYFYK